MKDQTVEGAVGRGLLLQEGEERKGEEKMLHSDQTPMMMSFFQNIFFKPLRIFVHILIFIQDKQWI